MAAVSLPAELLEEVFSYIHIQNSIVPILVDSVWRKLLLDKIFAQQMAETKQLKYNENREQASIQTIQGERLHYLFNFHYKVGKWRCTADSHAYFVRCHHKSCLTEPSLTYITVGD
jgi:hypothetical protein